MAQDHDQKGSGVGFIYNLTTGRLMHGQTAHISQHYDGLLAHFREYGRPDLIASTLFFPDLHLDAETIKACVEVPSRFVQILIQSGIASAV